MTPVRGAPPGGSASLRENVLMRVASVPLGRMPGSSALFSAYVSGDGRAARFYRHAAFSLEGWLAAAREAVSGGARRAEVAEALRGANSGCDALARLAEPGTVAVVTGQQAGLFGGPAYTLYKALTAVHVARRLEAAGQPAVPVFWVAGEDHDLDEVSHAHVFDTRMRPVRLEADESASRGRPVGTIAIGSPPLQTLAAALEGFAHGRDTAALVAECYPPGRTFSEAFRALLGALLRPYGVVFVDPLEPRLRRLAAPLLERAWRMRDELGEAVRARGAELEREGFHAQVETAGGAGLFFLLEDGIRRRASERAQAADPAAWSPNALLRPVMQDWLLPTAIYVGGPAEVAYFAQSAVLYEKLLGRMPVVLPRAAFTLVDGRTRRLMERFGVTVADCLRGEEALIETIAARLSSQSLEREFSEAGRVIGGRLEQLGAALAALDPTLGQAMQRSRVRINWQLEKLRRKAARAALRKQAEVEQQARHAFRLVSPERKLQERYYSFVAFLALHGNGLLEDLLAAIDAARPSHEVLAL